MIAETTLPASPAIRAVIIDDEAGCIANLSSFLSRYCPGVEVVGTGATVAQARALVGQMNFDVAFMDVELAHETVFDVFGDRVPAFPTVLVTAHDRYAVRAFRIEALDYLLKPLCSEDITRCYAKILRTVRPESAMVAPEAPVARPAADEGRKVLLRSGERVYVQRLSDIVYLEASGFYTNVIFWSEEVRRSVLLSKPMGQVMEEFGASSLLRIHKSVAVNLGHVRTVRKGESMVLQMDTGEELAVAKRRVQEVLDRLTGARS